MLNYQQKLILEAILGLEAYAGYLAETALSVNKDQINKILNLVEWMAVYDGIEDENGNSGESIRQKFLEPIAQLLEGKKVSSIPEFEKKHRDAIQQGLSNYARELRLDRDPGNEDDIKLCMDILKDISQWRREDKLAADAIEGLKAYAGYLAEIDLERYREKIEDVWDLIEQMATYFAVEGVESGAFKRIKEKHLDPITFLLEGKNGVSLPEYNLAYKSAICRGVYYYQNDLKEEIGEENCLSEIKQCKEIMESAAEDIAVNSQEWTQIQM
ncbi:hypothetical protein [Hungatella hathewayi]